jgi:hypothetical protein
MYCDLFPILHRLTIKQERDSVQRNSLFYNYVIVISCELFKDMLRLILESSAGCFKTLGYLQLYH